MSDKKDDGPQRQKYTITEITIKYLKSIDENGYLKYNLERKIDSEDWKDLVEILHSHILITEKFKGNII